MVMSMNTKSIREGIKKLYESWPSVLNSLSKDAKDAVRRALSNHYIDIENTPSSAIEVVSSRDPRLKDGMTIFDFGVDPTKQSKWYTAEQKHPIAVFVNGKAVVDAEVPGTSRNVYDDYARASALPWKTVISLAKGIYYMSFDDVASRDANKELRSKRSDMKNGTVTRYRDTDKQGRYGSMKYNAYAFRNEFDQQPHKYDTIDKSGFVLNPNKYIDMLAAAGIKEGDKILRNAKDLYRKLAAISADHLSDRDPNYWGNGNVYTTTLNDLAVIFRRLEEALKEYNDEVEKYGEKAASRFAAGTAERYLKDLRDVMRRAHELVKKEGM